MRLFLMAACVVLAACSKSDTNTDDSGVDDSGVEVEPTLCEGLGLSEVGFDATGPHGIHRRDLADDFTVALIDGTSFTLADQWTGCDGIVFIPHWLPVDDLDDASVWTTSVADLIERSPINARYFFVGMRDDADLQGMQDSIDQAVASLSEDDAAWWGARLHVPAAVRGNLGSWLDDKLAADHGLYGFGIDRSQRIRGLGSMASVEAYDAALNAAGLWPFERRLFSASHEVRYMNFEAERQARLDAVDATVVTFWEQEVHEQYEDVTVDLPSAADIAGFDTLEVDVIMECPDPEGPEVSNCGAWDYLAHVYVQDGESWLEVARFITTYHRESRWVVDASHALPWLADGGSRTFRYEWAPSWNTQPTSITVRLRFSDQGKEARPSEVHPLFTGGAFNSAYNDGRVPIAVSIPADAKKVELAAIITGHGADTGSCAEFCNHQHEFTVGGEAFLEEFPEAQSESGCADDVGQGTVPNQWGTWWFGRGGWCPGRRVDPYKVDVTDLATPGSDLEISYRGLYRNSTPPDNAGNVLMNSWLVISR